jgi:hypothetical protein
MDYLIAGMSNIRIAELLDMTKEAVSGIRRSPVFQDELAQRRAILTNSIDQATVVSTVDITKMVNDKLKSESIAAVEKLCDLRDTSEVDSVARASASDILDRAGFGKLTKVENTNTGVFVIDKSDLARIEAAIHNDRPETNKTIDAEFVDVSTNNNSTQNP